MTRREAAKALLEDVHTCASVVYMSALAVFGSELQDFEPETLRIECATKEIKVPAQNWEELNAALALRGDGRFMIDANVFENTIVAFNGEEPDVSQIQVPIPAHIAWGVREAALITADLIEEFEDHLDYEPTSYTAAVCKAHGMVYVPDCLSFCEDRLAELTREHEDVREEVKKRWERLQRQPDAERAFREDVVGVQLAHLSAVHEFVCGKVRQQHAQMAKLL